MKEKVQVVGRFFSGMVMPNIGAFIAWGLITALFIPAGWWPNETLAGLVGPMLNYLLPLLIAYTGGSVVAGIRGGVIGAIASMGIIAGADIPMFLGAMLMGPLAGWVIKKFDKVLEGKIPTGFEMLVNNFSLGIIGAILAGVGMVGAAPLVEGLNSVMEACVGFFVDRGLLPLASIFIEPAKVLFLNNAINHGILSPLGLKQAEELGKSIFFLLEANPGSGLGILLAYCLAGKGNAKTTAPGAVIIHFLGGIHEIYFPYILMSPLLILAAIAGGATGIFVLDMFNGGLVAPASPGSIIAVLAMTPKGGYLPVILGIAAACAVSFVVAIPILKFAGKEKQSKGVKEEAAVTVEAKDVTKIVFACDAGMGSSAMGAAVLQKKLAEAGRKDIKVEHASVSSIPADAQIVVTHQDLKERAAHSNPKAQLVLIKNFLAAPEYDELVVHLTK